MNVSAGLCFSGEKLWIFKRGAGRRNAHLWEFPGGKEESGESAEACLRRELAEELCLPLGNVSLYSQADWDGFHFTFLRCEALGTPRLTEHEACALVTPRELLGYPFCPVDAPVARRLALMHPPLRHFFWDFDGTIMDTYPSMVNCFIRAGKRLGFSADPHRVLSLMKDSLGVCVTAYAVEHGLSADALAAAFRQEEAQTSPKEMEPIPGIPQALATLSAQGGRHYLVTHRDRGAQTYLRWCGLEHVFTDVITSEDGFPRKPAPDSLIHLMRKHALSADTCVMIGDRPLDVDAGANAGMLSCLLDSDARFESHPCPLRASSARELPGLLLP